MKPTHFEIQFDNPQGEFVAGTAVSGRVLLNLAKPMKMRSLKILFVGKGNCNWYGEYDSYHGSEVYMNALMVLFEGDSSSGEKEHPAGNHTYPFSLQLLASFPSSFEGSKGHVRYHCECTIDRARQLNSTVKRSFTVIHHLNLNYVPQAPTTTYQGIIDPFLMFGHSGHPKYHVKTASFSLLHCNCHIKPRTSENINRSTLVPSLPPSGLEGCGIIYIDYNVELIVKCRGNKLKILKWIILGTVPLQEPPIQLPAQPSTQLPTLSTGPISEQPQSINLMDPVIVPSSTEEALATPPSYSECAYGPTTIRGADDGDNTTGDTTWAPACP